MNEILQWTAIVVLVCVLVFVKLVVLVSLYLIVNALLADEGGKEGQDG